MSIHVTKLSYALGAAVTNVDLSQELDAGTVAAIRQAWLDHLVLVFPGQNISPAEQIRFSRCLGPVEEYPLEPYRLPGHPEIFYLTNVGDDGRIGGAQMANLGRHWHSDLSFTAHLCVRGAVQRHRWHEPSRKQRLARVPVRAPDPGGIHLSPHLEAP